MRITLKPTMKTAVRKQCEQQCKQYFSCLSLLKLKISHISSWGQIELCDPFPFCHACLITRLYSNKSIPDNFITLIMVNKSYILSYPLFINSTAIFTLSSQDRIQCCCYTAVQMTHDPSKEVDPVLANILFHLTQHTLLRSYNY